MNHQSTNLQETTKPSGSAKKHLIPKLIIIACCLFAMAGLNAPHISPFRIRLPLSSVTSHAISEQGSVMVDKEQKRLLILSPDRKLTHIVDVTKSGSPIDRIVDAAIYDGQIYCIGNKSYYQGSYYSEEDIVIYDFQGKLKQTLPLQTYQESDFVNEYRYDSIRVTPDGLFVIGREDLSVVLYRITESGSELLSRFEMPECPYYTKFGPGDDSLFVIGMSLTYYRIDLHTGEIANTSREALYASYLDFFDLDPEHFFDQNTLHETIDMTVTYRTNGEVSHVTVTDPYTNEYVCFTDGQCYHDQPSEVDCSVGFLLLNWAFWLAAGVIAASAVGLVIYLIVKKLTRKGRVVLVIVGAILLTSIFYTVQSSKETENTYAQFLTTQTKQISLSLSDSYGDIFQSIGRRGISEYCADVDNQPFIENLNRLMKAMCDHNGTQKSCMYFVYLIDGESAYYLADSAHYYPTGFMIPLDENLKSQSQHTIRTTTDDSYATVLYDYDYLYASDGSVVGLFVASSMRGNMYSIKMQNAVNYFVLLSSLIVGIYIVYSVWSTLSSAIRNFKAEDPRNTDRRVVHMSVFFTFLTDTVTYLDGVIVIYVIRSLCTGRSMAEVASLAALTLSLVSAGILLGSVVCVPLCNKIGERTTAVISACCSMLSLLGCAAAIVMNSFVLFTIAQFLVAFFNKGVLNMLCESIPYHEKDENRQRRAIARVSSCSIAANIISMLLSGYISEYLSYSTIYIVGAVIVMLDLILFTLVLRNEKKDTTKEKAEVGGWKSWTVFLKGPILLDVVFHTIPAVILSGYSSYLFPLYSAGAGLSALLLSNLNVFVKTISYMAANSLRKVAGNMKLGFSSSVPYILTCLGLMYFYFCPNIFWAVFMLFVTALAPIVDKGILLRNRALQCNYYHIDRKEFNANCYSMKSVIGIFKSTVLSGAVGLGMDLACATVGLVCGAMLTVYGFCNKRFIAKVTQNTEES